MAVDDSWGSLSDDEHAARRMLSIRRLSTMSRRLRRSRRGSAAIEFALVGPVMIVLVVGVFDISKGLLLYQEVYNTAHDISVSASILAVQSNGSTSLSFAQTQQVMSIIWAEMPLLRSGVENGNRQIEIFSVAFQQNNANCVPSSTVACATTAYVQARTAYQQNNFSKGYTGAPSCAALNQVAATAWTPGDLQSIATAGVSNPDPIIVIDVYYQYTPAFLNFITGPISFWVSAYYPVRSAQNGVSQANQYTTLDPTDAAPTMHCW
jgi:Flp pilus assembly protein TadG